MLLEYKEELGGRPDEENLPYFFILSLLWYKRKCTGGRK